jgi:cytidylate kinase
MIITIDGPAGSGKSTAARKLAARLDIAYLDTGAMYRALALAALQQHLSEDDEAGIVHLAESLELDFDCGPTHTRVRVAGHDVSEAIRSMAATRMAGRVARIQAVRDLMVRRQRALGAALGSFVAEGRDQGSVVFPNADRKFVLEASAHTRALRRHQELLADGEEASLEEVLQSIVDRDESDSKQWAPLLSPGAAVLIDTTGMSLHDVVERLAEEVGPGSAGH